MLCGLDGLRAAWQAPRRRRSARRRHRSQARRPAASAPRACAIDPGRGRRSLRHDTVAVERQRHARRRLEPQPASASARAADQAPRTAPSARRPLPGRSRPRASIWTRIGRQRVAQPADQEPAVVAAGLGDDDAGPGGKPRQVVLPALLAVARRRCRPRKGRAPARPPAAVRAATPRPLQAKPMAPIPAPRCDCRRA